MNKSFKVIWNKSKGVFQAVSELAQNKAGNSSSSRGACALKNIAAGTLFLLALPAYAIDLPSGGQVVAG